MSKPVTKIVAKSERVTMPESVCLESVRLESVCLESVCLESVCLESDALEPIAVPKTARLSLSAVLAAVALSMSACGGGGDGAGNAGGLATLADDAATAADGGEAARTQLDDPSAASEPAVAMDTAAAPDPAAAAASGGSPDLDDMTDEERLLEFAQCMRDNGVDFPDPVIEADGTVAFGRRPGRGSGQGLAEIGRDPDLPKARMACTDLLQGLPFGPGGGRDFDDAELQDSLLDFARCMRDKGIDMPDPDFSGFRSGAGGDGPPPNPFAGMRDLSAAGADGEEVGAAIEDCRERLVAFGRFGGGGPGAGGAGR